MSDMKIKVILEEANVNKDFFTSNRKENNLKCPFCQQELRKIHPTYVICDNCRITGDKELWQALTDSMKEHDLCHDALVERTKELDRTRKALDVAIHRLNQIAEHDCDQGCMYVAQNALEQITALKQKESAFVHNKIEFPEYNDNLLEEFDKQFFENGQDDDLTETALEQKDK